MDLFSTVLHITASSYDELTTLGYKQWAYILRLWAQENHQEGTTSLADCQFIALKYVSTNR